MAIEIRMPALSPTMEEGTVRRWLKQLGEEVSPGDVLAEIETDKATMEVESIDEGVLDQILYSEGSEHVPVGAVIALLRERGAAPLAPATRGEVKSPEQQTHKQELPVHPLKQSQTEAQPSNAGALTDASSALQSSSPDRKGERPIASPLARKLAHLHGVDLYSVIGSGPKGRILERDILAVTAKGANTSLREATQARAVTTPHAYVDKPMSGMRKTIAKRLVESKQTIPHFYITVTMAVDALVRFREECNVVLEGTVRLSVNDLMVKAFACALHQHPEACAILVGDKIRTYQNVNLAVAISTEDGLYAPVVRDVEKKDLRTLSEEIKGMIRRAKARNLRQEEFEEGCAGVSNLGMYGISSFSAIINPPQSLMLAVGAIEERFIRKGSEIVPVSVIQATLSCDHRVVDGVLAAKVITALKAYVEEPLKLVL